MKSEYVVKPDVHRLEPSGFDADPIMYRTILNQQEKNNNVILCKRFRLFSRPTTKDFFGNKHMQAY